MSCIQCGISLCSIRIDHSGCHGNKLSLELHPPSVLTDNHIRQVPQTITFSLSSVVVHMLVANPSSSVIAVIMPVLRDLGSPPPLYTNSFVIISAQCNNACTLAPALYTNRLHIFMRKGVSSTQTDYTFS